MSLFDKLAGAQGVRMICGMTVTIGPNDPGNTRQFHVKPVDGGRKADYVLLALHYYSQVLSRYPKTESRTYELAGELRTMVERIVEEGIWPGSDLVRYARADGKMKVTDARFEGRTVNAAVIRPVMGDDLDMALELPANATDDELILSVVAVLQGMMSILDDDALELLDRALRYLRQYHNEGADYSDPAAARNMANRAFREAGGEIG
jgi:hypothetical protein